MTDKTPVKASREAFGAYATMDSPDLPECKMAQLQVELHRWEAREFGGGSSESSVLGTNEETGEAADAMIMLLGAQSATGRMAKAILKRKQGIRGYDDPEKFRSDLADAFADMMIFGIQACTKSRLDAWTLLSKTAEEVMGRKWSEDKIKGRPEPDFERSGIGMPVCCSKLMISTKGGFGCELCWSFLSNREADEKFRYQDCDQCSGL